MLTRDLEDPSKDGIKTRKIEFIFNYFDFEKQKSSLPPKSVENAVVEIQRLIIPSENFKKLNGKFWRQEQTSMSKLLVIEHIARMEDHTEVVCANFANPYIGGGALRKGCA